MMRLRFWVTAILLLLAMDGRALAEITLIPQPTSVTPASGFFVFRQDTGILAGPGTHDTARMLSQYLGAPTGYRFQVTEARGAKDNAIYLAIDSSLSGKLGKEGYRLEVTPRRIVIRAPAQAGLFYGAQTLRQLFPPAIYAAAKYPGVEWKAPAVVIEDTPRFAWRGALVDVARHFMPKTGLYSFIDAMAAIKLNRLHIHLTDNQAWRIEIRKYPQLAAQLRPTLEEQQRRNCRCGLQTGYYTQDDLRQIVAYAAERHITVIPEIEIPGHAGAAVAAMPEMGNFDATMPAGQDGTPHRLRVFNPSEKTILFLQDVLTEVMEVFPSELIHIGGDEVRKDEWENSPAAQARMRELGLKSLDELQSYIIGRMNQFLISKGRRLIGWDEIIEGGLAPGATVMAWRGTEGGVQAVRAGHDVVLAPTEFTYFDYYQTHDPREPFSHRYYLSLKKAYAYDAILPEITPEQARHVLGAQGQLWSTYMPTPYHLEYMAFPRLVALAEIVWSPSGEKDYEGFKKRLLTQQERWSILGVNFRPLDAATDDEEPGSAEF